MIAEYPVENFLLRIVSRLFIGESKAQFAVESRLESQIGFDSINACSIAVDTLPEDQVCRFICIFHLRKSITHPAVKTGQSNQESIFINKSLVLQTGRHSLTFFRFQVRGITNDTLFSSE